MGSFTSLLRVRFNLPEFTAKNLALSTNPPSSRVVRREFLVTLFLASLSLFEAACGASRTSTDKLLDAAHEHNGAVRFGRMDIALEHVSTATKSEWLQRRTGWKNKVRIIDVELEGMQLVAMGDANVQVRVAWQHIDEAELRSTEEQQKWQVKDGPWQLVKEDCTGGDTTLLTEPEKPKEK
jgi:hypothetical protein